MTNAFLALAAMVLKSAKNSVENLLTRGSEEGCCPCFSLLLTSSYNYALICQKTWRARDISNRAGGKRNIPTAVSSSLALTAPAWDKVFLPACWPIDLTCIKGRPRSLTELLTESALLSPSVRIPL